MKDLEIFENNALMARFMGAVWVEEKECWKDSKSNMKHLLDNSSKLWFENNWEWLMSVVDMIEIGLDLGFNVVIKNDKCRIYRNKGSAYEVVITKLYEGEKFPSTYDAIVEFIIWYNEWIKENK